MHTVLRVLRALNAPGYYIHRAAGRLRDSLTTEVIIIFLAMILGFVLAFFSLHAFSGLLRLILVFLVGSLLGCVAWPVFHFAFRIFTFLVWAVSAPFAGIRQGCDRLLRSHVFDRREKGPETDMAKCIAKERGRPVCWAAWLD